MYPHDTAPLISGVDGQNGHLGETHQQSAAHGLQDAAKEQRNKGPVQSGDQKPCRKNGLEDQKQRAGGKTLDQPCGSQDHGTHDQGIGAVEPLHSGHSQPHFVHDRGKGRG